MGLKFKAGDKVRQVMPDAIVGTVAEATIVDSEVHFRVESTGPDGHPASRFFSEDQLEAVPAAPATAAK